MNSNAVVAWRQQLAVLSRWFRVYTAVAVVSATSTASGAMGL